MRTPVAAILALGALTGCHETCGSWSPIWIAADCAIIDTGADSGADCALDLDLVADGDTETTVQGTDPVELTATITNTSGAPLTVTVEDLCPDGLAMFDGLGARYDYYGSCLAGACWDSGVDASLTLEIDESIEVRTTITPGGDSCNEALAPGAYDVTFDLALYEGDPLSVCAPAPVTLTVE